MMNSSHFWTKPKLRTLYLLGGTALLSIGTPAIIAIAQPGARFYLLQPMIFAAQIVPNVIAASLWLPWRSAHAQAVGFVLARVLFVASALFYLPIVTGIVPTGGDMIGLGYMLIAIVTGIAIAIATMIGFAVSWALQRRTSRKNGRVTVR
jgi:hypothetical protein